MSTQGKRIWGQIRAAALLLGLLILLIPACAGAENLLVNGSFEETDSRGLPVGWTTDAYLRDEGYSLFTTVEDPSAKDGGKYVSIQNIADNDARFAQTVAVNPESLYRFSGYVKAEGVEKGRGANLSIEGLYVFSDSLYDTAGEWEYIEWYGETGPDQTAVTLFARLGGYSGESQGRAWFDQLELTEVDEVPGDLVADFWYRDDEPAYYGDDEDEAEDDAGSEFWPYLILISLAYAVAAVLLLSMRGKGRTDLRKKPGFTETIPLLCGLCLAMVLRLVLSARIAGYEVDVNDFVIWGRIMREHGPTGFYSQTGFCDYPPAYTYVLGLNSLISGWFPNAGEGTLRVIFRFFPCLCDLLGCWLIARFARKRCPDVSPRVIDVFSLLLAFNPALIINSAAWGQMDSVVCVCLLAVALFAMEGRWEISLPAYMLSVLIKPQALMLGFLGLAAVGIAWFREKENRKRILIGLAAAAGVALVIIVPFSIGQEPGWLIRLYAGTLGSYSHATVNAANFYYLLNGNWRDIGNAAPTATPVILAVLCAGYTAIWSLRARKTQKRLLIEQVLTGLFVAWFIWCAVTSASWGTIGAAAMAFAFLIVLSLFIRRGDIRFLPYFGALLFLLLFSFGLKMHERYLFPAFFLLACAWWVHRDWRILLVLLCSSVTVFINEGIILDNCIRLGASMGHLNNDTKSLADLVSMLNMLSTLYAVHVGIDLCLRDQVAEPLEQPLIREIPGDSRLGWKKKDTLILCAILAAYSLVSFTTLGSTKAPQTAWTSTDYTEAVTLDLGERREDFTMLYFARVSRYNFTIAVSDDAENWSDEIWAEMEQGSCFKWKYLTESYDASDESLNFTDTRVLLSGRYVRITAHQIGLALCEVLFRDGKGNVLPVSVLRRVNENPDSPLLSDPANLADEQDTMEALPLLFPSELTKEEGEENPLVAQPGWWNSTYFDEIYHARTAWEFLNHSAPYETTHPPLGKVLMSWSVAVFGMTPFGWRFAGALAGVAMLAGMYLIGKQLTKSTMTGALMSGLMALDCMHLTQTQIATIDSFPLVFIIFSYFFMLRFLQTDLASVGKKRLLIDLGCCGLFMGLGIASKWITIYAGAGLAVLFLIHCVRYLVKARKNAGAESRQEGKPSGKAAGTKKSGAQAWKSGKPSGKAAGQKNGAGQREAGKEAAPAVPGAFLPDAKPFSRICCICCWCVLFFVIVPVAIYLLSYIPYFAYKQIGSVPEYVREVWKAQEGMFSYHSTPGLGMDHPFYSPWYEWPVMGKPMFYATKQYVFNDAFSHSIFCFGNPVIWFPALGTMALCAFAWIHDRMNLIRIRTCAAEERISLRAETPVVFLMIGFLAQYLPWMLVPRGTYIYHYFASVPFLILSIALVVHQVRLRSRVAGMTLSILFLVLAAAALAVFFPYVTGIMAPVEWLDYGKQFLKIWY